MKSSLFFTLTEYLPLLNSIITTDLFFMILLFYTKYINSKFLSDWYTKYRLSGVIADVSIILIGFIIAKYLYPKIFKEFSNIKFIVLLLSVQIAHDLLFYGFFSVIPRGANKMLDLFKDYAKEVGTGAILGDSAMMVMSFIIFIIIKRYSNNINIIILVILLYFMPYILWTR